MTLLVWKRMLLRKASSLSGNGDSLAIICVFYIFCIYSKIIENTYYILEK